MSKAIAVLDEMPEGCSSCPFSIKYGQVMLCVKLRREVDELPDDYRPEWCFLKPMPKPMYAMKDDEWHEYSEGYMDGRNECIEEIGGMKWTQ